MSCCVPALPQASHPHGQETGRLWAKKIPCVSFRSTLILAPFLTGLTLTGNQFSAYASDSRQFHSQLGVVAAFRGSGGLLRDQHKQCKKILYTSKLHIFAGGIPTKLYVSFSPTHVRPIKLQAWMFQEALVCVFIKRGLLRNPGVIVVLIPMGTCQSPHLF